MKLSKLSIQGLQGTLILRTYFWKESTHYYVLYDPHMNLFSFLASSASTPSLPSPPFIISSLCPLSSVLFLSPEPCLSDPATPGSSARLL